MANELQLIYSSTGLTSLYCVMQRLSDHQLINATSGAAQSLTSANWASSAIALSDTGHAGVYVGTIPSGLAAGVYIVTPFDNATPVQGDYPIGYSEVIYWNGTAVVGVSTQDVANALNLAPGGSAAAGSANARLAGLAGSVLTSQNVADALNLAPGGSAATNSANARLAAIQNNSVGTGAYAVTVHVTDGTAALANASVRLGSNLLLQSDSSGNVVFSVDAATYTLAVTKGGYSYTPTSHTVTGAATITAAMTANSIPTSTVPNTIVGVGVTVDSAGNSRAGAEVAFVLTKGPGTAGNVINSTAQKVVSDTSGNLYAHLIQGATYKVYGSSAAAGTSYTVVAPSDETSFTLPEILVQ